jgi:hypothetical protein
MSMTVTDDEEPPNTAVLPAACSRRGRLRLPLAARTAAAERNVGLANPRGSLPAHRHRSKYR